MKMIFLRVSAENGMLQGLFNPDGERGRESTHADIVKRHQVNEWIFINLLQCKLPRSSFESPREVQKIKLLTLVGHVIRA